MTKQNRRSFIQQTGTSVAGLTAASFIIGKSERAVSAILAHLGSISYRLGHRKLFFDSVTESFTNDDEANGLLKRKYREPYVIPETV